MFNIDVILVHSTNAKKNTHLIFLDRVFRGLSAKFSGPSKQGVDACYQLTQHALNWHVLCVLLILKKNTLETNLRHIKHTHHFLSGSVYFGLQTIVYFTI